MCLYTFAGCTLLGIKRQVKPETPIQTEFMCFRLQQYEILRDILRIYKFMSFS